MTNQIQKPAYYIALIILFLIAGLFFSNNASCQVVPVQSDTVLVNRDSSTTTIIPADSVKRKVHSPRRAALYSAILPGLGQIYNRKYWKLPIIYTGAAVSGSFIYYNYTIYAHLRDAYIYRAKNGPTAELKNFSVLTITGKLNIDLNQFQNSDLLSLQESYRRDLDLSVIFAVAVYGLNVLDAVVDAHLFYFDVSDKLTMHIEPQFSPMGGFSRSCFGVNLNMHF